MALTSTFADSSLLAHSRAVADKLAAHLCAKVIGRAETIRLVIIALLADGHVLLEDYPGSGKTLLARELGAAIAGGSNCDTLVPFRRIQFTPDLLPSDITGTSVFDASTCTFHFRPGPVFAWIVLADEINRTSPKVQAAVLEPMAEKQVTVENVTHRLDDLFFVIATQNPLDSAGTYPLPVAQLDRFMFQIRMKHISRDAELEVLRAEQWTAGGLDRVTREEILDARLALGAIEVSPEVDACLVDAARAMREHQAVAQGVSTRSLKLMRQALRASALLDGRDYVSAPDIELLAPYVFAHRLVLARAVDSAEAVVAACLEAPLERLARRTLSWR